MTQCDNLVLMRLNSAADTAYAQEVFSFVPAGLLAARAGAWAGGGARRREDLPVGGVLRFGARDRRTRAAPTWGRTGRPPKG